jgi:hypothetical protein
MTKRKTMAEIRAEERAAGFEQCLAIVRREWRRNARIVQMEEMSPVERARWDILMKCDEHAGLLDDDFKEHMMPRVFPQSEWRRLRVRVVVQEPHPHAGRPGFICDSKAFVERGCYRVWFTDRQDLSADNAMVPEGQFRRVGGYRPEASAEE